MKYKHKFEFSVFLAFYDKICLALDNWPRNGNPEQYLVYLCLDKLSRRLYKYTYKDTGIVTVVFSPEEMTTIIASLPKIQFILGNYEAAKLRELIQAIDSKLLIV